MRTMIWSRIYPASSNRILKHTGWSVRTSGSTKLSETQAPIFVFHLLCSFHVHGWKALCIFQGMRRKRDMRQPSPGPLPAPSCQDSVTCLFLIARKLGNHVSAPRSEKEKRRGLSPPSACEKLCLEQTEMESPSECIVNPALFIAVPSPGGIRLQSLVPDLLSLLHTQTWIIQGKSMVYSGNRFAGCQSPV